MNNDELYDLFKRLVIDMRDPKDFEVGVDSILSTALDVGSYKAITPISYSTQVTWDSTCMCWDASQNIIHIDAGLAFNMTPSNPTEWWVHAFTLYNPITERSRVFEVEANTTPEFTRCFSASTQEDSRVLALFLWWDSSRYSRMKEGIDVLASTKVK